jgi:hypothetical protein
MPLNSEVLREIDGFVRGGFEERERIIEILCEEMHEPGELDEAEVTIAVDAAFASLEKDKATWPSMTDCDKLDRVFALKRMGFSAQWDGTSNQRIFVPAINWKRR